MIGSAEVAGLSLVAAGCGGSSRNGVAQVPSTQRTTTGTELSAGAKRNADLAYSVCMRKHGVPKFPDPEVASSGVRVRIDKSAPQFRRAEQACRKLLPNGGIAKQHEQAKHLQEALDYAACMRGNGVPRFPDPTAAADGGPDCGEIGASSGVNPSSPRFKAAQKACHELLPGSPFGAGPERS
jgi:hypothetical protein